MPQPRLIHPINIIFELINRSISVFDKYARAPVGQVIRAGESVGSGDRVTIKGQVSYYFGGAKKEYANFDRGGVEETSIGYVAFRYKDMLHLGLIEINDDGQFENLNIKRGDRIIQIGKDPVDYYVDGFRPFGHYPKLDQTLIQVNFTDRSPGYQQGDL